MKITFTMKCLVLFAGMMLVASALFATGSAASVRHRADVRVWVGRGVDSESRYECGGGHVDVYPAYDDVTVYLRASRSCYATVYVIDTDGFVHVVYPFSPYESAYVVGGRVYRFSLRHAGFDAGRYGRGVAYVYAVSSPVPFAYARYGLGVFGPRFAFRICGDPFVASRRFYLSLLPGSCDFALVGVSFSRFYVREYARYPLYLCLGWHVDCGVRKYCRGDCEVYEQFRKHAKDPYRVLRPSARVEHIASGGAEGRGLRKVSRKKTVPSGAEHRAGEVAYAGSKRTVENATVVGKGRKAVNKREKVEIDRAGKKAVKKSKK